MVCLPSDFTHAEPGPTAVVDGTQIDYTPEQVRVRDDAKRLTELNQKRDYIQALEFGEAAYSTALESLSSKDLNVVALGLYYAFALQESGNYERSREVAGAMLARVEAVLGKDSGALIEPLMALGVSSGSETRLASFERALELHRKYRPDNKAEYAGMTKVAGRYLSFQKVNKKRGIELLRESLALHKSIHGDQSTEIIQPLMWLGEAQIEANDFRASKRLFDRAINIARKSGDRDLYADQLFIAGRTLMDRSFSRETEKYLKKSHKEFRTLYGEDRLETAHAQMLLAEYYLREKKYGKAEPGLRQALGVFESDPNYQGLKLSALSLLVELHELRGESDLATPYCLAISETQPWDGNREMTPIFKRRVKFPPEAAYNGSRGYVVTEFSVDENGFVQSPVVIESDGPKSFEREALRAISGYRYAPRYVDGIPVSTPKVTSRVIFKLDRRPTRY